MNPPVPTPDLSVIVCTHNPRADYLAHTLDSLRGQTLPTDRWELIIVDNASRESVAGRVELGWQPHAKIVTEPTPGLTVARVRGIASAAAPLLVWVDDDNALAPDYLAQAAALAEVWPRLGVYGCGAYTPAWEKAPAPELTPLLAYLAVHKVAGDRWSNLPGDWSAVPAGAGLCVRLDVAQRYAALVRDDPRRRKLGRTGTQLAGGEDFDLAFTALDLGYGTGVFTRLALTHYMPAGRVRPDYLLRLAEGHAFSMVVLQALRGAVPAGPTHGMIARLREARYRRTLGPIERQLHDAKRAGERRALSLLAADGRIRTDLAPPPAP
jgi:glycosyltransferase involved in cell wall biosynthesis